MPEASDRAELQNSFGMIDGFPHAAARVLPRRVVPGLAADPVARREDEEGAHRHEHHRHAVPRAGRPGRGVRHDRSPERRPAQRRRRPGWMPEEFAAASAAHIFPKRHKHVRETIEIMQGVWTNDLFEYHGEFADFDPCGFGVKPVQDPHRRSGSADSRDAERSAKRIAKYNLAGWIGIQDNPDGLADWRKAIDVELRGVGPVDRRDRDVQHDLVRHHRRGRRPVAGGQGHQPARRNRRSRSPRCSSATRRPG